MLSANTFFEALNYKEIVASLVEVMAENFEDFAEDLVRFNETISWFEKQLAQDTSPSVAEVVDSIDQRVGSMMVFSYFLGLKANWDHFINPIGRTFLDVDAEVYLREDIARRLPDYQKAQRVQEQFYATLSPAQQVRYEDITTYICHLESVGPKLAHYYGYILGNQLFPRIIPGYSVDVNLTSSYQHILENYLGLASNNIRKLNKINQAM